jgi:hypothetical protein
LGSPCHTFAVWSHSACSFVNSHSAIRSTSLDQSLLVCCLLAVLNKMNTKRLKNLCYIHNSLNHKCRQALWHVRETEVGVSKQKELSLFGLRSPDVNHSVKWHEFSLVQSDMTGCSQIYWYVTTLGATQAVGSLKFSG